MFIFPRPESAHWDSRFSSRWRWMTQLCDVNSKIEVGSTLLFIAPCAPALSQSTRRMFRSLSKSSAVTRVMSAIASVANETGLMRAVVADGAGNAVVTERQIPVPGENEQLMKVTAVGVNRADLLQIAGMYPPPQGATDILGLEAAGRLETGELVSALLTGGGFAEYVAVPDSAILRFPVEEAKPMTSSQLAAIPEAFLAAFHIMFQKGGLSENETVFINAAGSGVGTSAIQLASTVPNVRIIACAGSDEKLKVCKSLGAHHAINYKLQSISEAVLAATNGTGAHLVLDCVGAVQFKENERSLRPDGRWVMYGLLSGAKSPEIGLAGIVKKRLSIMGTTMRSRNLEYRAQIVSLFMQQFGDHFREKGPLQPTIHKEFQGLDSAIDAFDYLRSNQNIGKLVVSLEH